MKTVDSGETRFCSNKCARSYSTYQKRETINTTVSNSLQGRERPDQQARENTSCKVCGETFERVKSSSQKYCSVSCKNKCPDLRQRYREIAKERDFGGQTSRKTIHYEKLDGTEVQLHSSFEVQVAETLDENDIDWERPSAIEYQLEGETRRYYPDFYLPKFDVYLDPKNDYLIETHREKLKAVRTQNKLDLYVLSKNELTWEKISHKVE